MSNEDESTVYNAEGREEMVDDDELSPEEQAFMKGYEEAEDEEEDEEKDKDEDSEDE